MVHSFVLLQQQQRQRQHSPTVFRTFDTMQDAVDRLATPSRLRYGIFSKTKTTKISVLKAMELDWQSMIYSVESMAGSIAAATLGGGGVGSSSGGGFDGIISSTTTTTNNVVTTWWQSLPIMYGAGLLTAASPCVWGLLPVTMTYISQAAGERRDQDTVLPAMAFAAGLASVFCTLGITAAEVGTVFGAGSTGHPIAEMALNLLSHGICLAMGLKLLELIDLPLPNFDFLDFRNLGKKQGAEPILIDGTGQIMDLKQSKDLDSDENNALVRTFFLGGSSALVASPCATPVLTSILAFVAASQNAAVGAALLFCYTLGYATPLLYIAATGGRVLLALKQQSASQQQQQSKDDHHHSNDMATSLALNFRKLGPWVTPLSGGVLLFYGANGVLVSLFGDPSLAGLAPILE